MAQVKPFGSWPSPVTADSLSAGSAANDTWVDNGYIYWCQSIAAEKGRGQIFKQRIHDNATPEALLPEGFSCQTRVHEYGGGAFKVSNDLVVFSNDYDRRLYTISNGNMKPLTEENEFYRYADYTIDKENKFLVCVREQHFPNEEPKDVVNVLVSIDLSSGKQTVIAQGEDFYASPRLFSQNKLTFVCWSHPNMPWDYTRLYVAQTEYQNGALVLKNSVCVAGDKIDESISQPNFGIDGTLYFASDRSGFWNLYAYNGQEVSLLLESPLEQEFVGPAWSFNSSEFTPLKSNPHQLVTSNKDSLAIIDTQKKTMTNLSSKYTSFDHLRIYLDQDQNEYVLGNFSSPTEPVQLVSYDLKQQSIYRVHQTTATSVLEPDYVSVGQEIAFPTTDNKTAYCYYYAPKNPNYKGEGLPPLRVMSHGGPTSSSSNSFRRAIQYWTTRGFAIADVNYGGSTGYGREYRERLRLKWGIVDVDDCCNAALYLAKQGLVDAKKLAIVGGSAGGFTTLASVAFRKVFQAGCCLYGVSDITLLAKETHKFESRYPDRLIGEYPKDEKVYQERSPINRADEIECPVIFFQGSEDKVVPPSQSEVMVNAMKEKGVPVAYVLYEGEAHGFRRAENIKRTMELEQWFYGQIFDFPVEGVEGIEIYNFPKK
ncbi:Alpha/Beta hydrolase protein [Gilbertella persicaria]|uniref:Dipeptidyl aminopeptidase n=1 Tax=Rhizopus stolonifer TaxID=4846 RepID=A0A367KMS0_RHIST|nr:Alpha/Beta hydrolase protein [Gilbertella persicaria]KAI8090890.1 Alpha/Beta hydrolase protein [Gilbertella persicaria]RCI03420.1 Dipeptidyl aminopeptidase [Rhizopus stolonifer]